MRRQEFGTFQQLPTAARLFLFQRGAGTFKSVVRRSSPSVIDMADPRRWPSETSARASNAFHGRWKMSVVRHGALLALVVGFALVPSAARAQGNSDLLTE